MITLFRRIRQKLIDSGSITKYLLYAIGEILLVVIGILIALQVNNWNEQRNALQNEKVLLHEVKEALQADSLQLETMAGFMDSTFAVYTQLYKISSGELSPDSLRNADLMRASIINGPISKVNYPDLAQNVMNQRVKNRVFEYYQVVSTWEYIIVEYNRFIEEEMRPFLGDQELLVYGFHHYGDPNRPGKIEKTKLIRKLNDPEIQQKLFEATQKTRNYIGIFEEIENERVNFRAEINEIIQ